MVNVTDLNDNRPVFYPVRYYSEVSETAWVGYKVATVSAIDTDSGVNGQITYQLASSSRNDKFSVDMTSGDVTVASSLTAGQGYTLHVRDKPMSCLFVLDIITDHQR